MSDNPEVSVVPTHEQIEHARHFLANQDLGFPMNSDERQGMAYVLAKFRLAHQTPPATQPSATRGEVERLTQALRDVVNPLGYLQRKAEAEGNVLGGMAYAIANDLGTVQRIASDAIAATPTPPADITEDDVAEAISDANEQGCDSGDLARGVMKLLKQKGIVA